MRRSILNLSRFLFYPKPRVDETQLKCRFKGRWVVITGASRGIGAALAKRLMRAGANLYLVARSETELQALCDEAQAMNCKAVCCALDLRDRSALKLLCHNLEQLPQVDYLFCNAGKSICRKIADATERLHDFDRTMDLNYRSVVALALTFYPPAPGWSAYHASKCATNVWCRTAECEWKPFGVGVHVAYLPLVRTEMSMANPHYRSLPAYSADDAACILLRLAMGHHFSYQPWWSRLTTPVAWAFAPLVRYFYQKSVL